MEHPSGRGLLLPGFVLLGSLIAAGCGSGVPQVTTPPLGPAKLGISEVLVFDDDTTGGLGGDVRLARKADEIVAGFERFHSPDPQRDIQHFYRGAVWFDLSKISAIKSKVVDNATLSYQLRQSYVKDASGAPEQFPNLVSCAVELLLATSDWTPLISPEGYATSHLPGDFLQSLPSGIPGGGSVFRIDATKWVRDWVAKPHENFGLIFKGRDEASSPGRNDVCGTRYGDFSLEVRYTVFEP